MLAGIEHAVLNAESSEAESSESGEGEEGEEQHEEIHNDSEEEFITLTPTTLSNLIT